jgi:RimJ/RimL family protein N-acetyltransferase
LLTGFISQTHQLQTYFLWQIGVDPSLQGLGMGKKLISNMEENVLWMGAIRIEVTIDPMNNPSQKLFEKMGYKNISKQEGSTIIVIGKEAVMDYYKPERHFMLYEKKLIK